MAERKGPVSLLLKIFSLPRNGQATSKEFRDSKGSFVKGRLSLWWVRSILRILGNLIYVLSGSSSFREPWAWLSAPSSLWLGLRGILQSMLLFLNGTSWNNVLWELYLPLWSSLEGHGSSSRVEARTVDSISPVAKTALRHHCAPCFAVCWDRHRKEEPSFRR